MRNAIALRCAQPYAAGVLVTYPKVATTAIAAITDPAAASTAGRRRDRRGPHTSSAAPASCQAHRGVDRRPSGNARRPADISFHDQLIDAKTAAQQVLGQHRQAKSRVEHARHQRRPGTSGGQHGTSAAPVTARASAVLNVIGFWLPKRKTAVARASQATITVTPIAAHSRPPTSVIAADTRTARDGTSAGHSGAPGSGAGDIFSAPMRLHLPPRTSNGYHRPMPVTAAAVRPGGIPATGKAHPRPS